MSELTELQAENISVDELARRFQDDVRGDIRAFARKVLDVVDGLDGE
jgi:hypothetical protein